MLLLRPLRQREAFRGRVPPKSLLVPLQARVNFCTSTVAQEYQQIFAQKQVITNSFIWNSKTDQVNVIR